MAKVNDYQAIIKLNAMGSSPLRGTCFFFRTEKTMYLFVFSVCARLQFILKRIQLKVLMCARYKFDTYTVHVVEWSPCTS